MEETSTAGGMERGPLRRASFLTDGTVFVRDSYLLAVLVVGLIWSANSGADVAQSEDSTASDQTAAGTSTSKFPARAVRLVEPFGLGGGPGLTARALARELTRIWKVPADVDNRAGVGSTLAPKLVADSPPDGYTLLVSTSAQAYSAGVARDLRTIL